MKRRILSFAAVAGFAILAFSLVSLAQPVTTGGGLSRVNNHGSGGLVGSGTTTNPESIRRDCGTGSGLTWDGNSWECGAVGGVSDGDKGDVTVSSSGATWTIDNSTVPSAKLNITTTTCSAGSAVTAISSGAVGTCSAVGVSDGDKGDITVSSSGAAWDVDSGAIGPTELADNLDLSSNGTTKTGNTLGAWISPSAITGTTNDWNPTGLSGARNVYVDLSGNATITGVQGGADGRELTLCNSHATAIITFSNESGSSTAGNRIRMPGASSWKLYGSTYFAANGQPECGTFVYKGTPVDRWIMKSWASQDMPSLEVLGTFYPATIAGAPNFTTNVTSTGNWTLGNNTTDTVTVSGDLTVNDTTTLTGVVSAAGDVTFSNAASDFTVSGDTSLATLQTSFETTLGSSDSVAVKFSGKPYALGTAPALSVCGTSPTIVGNDKAGTVTLGTGSPTGCTLTFNGGWSTNAPICVVSSNTASRSYRVTSSSTTSIVVTQDSAAASASFNYICMGRL